MSKKKYEDIFLTVTATITKVYSTPSKVEFSNRYFAGYKQISSLNPFGCNYDLIFHLNNTINHQNTIYNNKLIPSHLWNTVSHKVNQHAIHIRSTDLSSIEAYRYINTFAVSKRLITIVCYSLLSR